MFVGVSWRGEIGWMTYRLSNASLITIFFLPGRLFFLKEVISVNQPISTPFAHITFSFYLFVNSFWLLTLYPLLCYHLYQDKGEIISITATAIPLSPLVESTDHL